MVSGLVAKPAMSSLAHVILRLRAPWCPAALRSRSNVGGLYAKKGHGMWYGSLTIPAELY
jgi:hypothetical protein